MTASMGVTGRADARSAHLLPVAFEEICESLRAEVAELEEQSAALDLILRGLAAGSAEDLAERDLVEAHASRAHETLEAARAALARIADGTYGSCAGCGVPIPVERLQAVPAADHCVTCPPRVRKLR